MILKNNKGVTILILVVTIVLMLILAGVSLNTGFSVLDDMRMGSLVSNMNLVQAKAEVIYENYTFYNNDTDCLVGSGPYQIDHSLQLGDVKLSQEELQMIAQEAEVSEEEVQNWDWYQWSRADLEAQDLDADMLAEDEFFYIHYESAEVICSQGVSFENSKMYHSITGLKNKEE